MEDKVSACWDCGRVECVCNPIEYCHECGEEIGYMCVCGKSGKAEKTSDILKKVTPAPAWLVERMEALRKMPPPTLEEVRQQFEASAKWADEHGFGCVEEIKKAQHIR